MALYCDKWINESYHFYFVLVPNPGGLSSNNLDDAINVLRNHATDFAAGGLTSIGGVPSGVPPHSTNGATTTGGPAYGLDDLSAESVAAAAVAGGYQLPHHQPDTSMGSGMAPNIAGSGGTVSKKRKAPNSSGGGSNLSGEDLKPSSSSVGVAGASTSKATSSTKRGGKRGRKPNDAPASVGKFLCL